MARWESLHLVVVEYNSMKRGGVDYANKEWYDTIVESVAKRRGVPAEAAKRSLFPDAVFMEDGETTVVRVYYPDTDEDADPNRIYFVSLGKGEVNAGGDRQRAITINDLRERVSREKSCDVIAVRLDGSTLRGDDVKAALGIVDTLGS